MNNITKRISLAKHIVVIASMNPSADSLGSASAMYLYCLQKHKKVSFFCKTKNLNQKYSFLPWFEKIRNSLPSSADLAISFDCNSLESLGNELTCELINIDNNINNTMYGDISFIDSQALSTTHIIYNFLKLNDVNIHAKFAISLYAGILEKSEGLLSPRVTGEVFDILKELRECVEDFTLCNENIVNYQTLAGIRLKSLMLKNMQLHCNGQVALFILLENDMLRCGVQGEEYLDALEESLHLPTVKLGLVIKENSDKTRTCFVQTSSNINLLTLVSLFSVTRDRNRMNFTINKNEDIFEISNRIINIIEKEI